MALRALSLCAGIGGIDLGLRGVARTICYVEREAFAAAILRARMQDGSLDDAPIWSDLGTFDARAWRGAVDLVTGGYPCQPFSVAGKRRGEDDERHLWPQVRRIIDESGSPLVFLENVPGHLHLGFADVLADLAALGFDAEWGLFTAREVGAPHKRERLFVLAYRERARWAPGVRLDIDAGRESATRGAGVADAEGCDGGLQLLEGRSRVAGSQPRGCGEDVADTRRAERRPPTRRGCDDNRNDAEREEATGRPGERGAVLGDTDRDGLRLESVTERGCGSAPFPPGPSDRAGWERWIAAGGPLPAVRRDADGLRNRLDRLRALGNAVVPQVAARAFAELSHRVNYVTTKVGAP